jgi:hypothetical protein
MNSIYIQTHCQARDEALAAEDSGWLNPFQARIAAIYLEREAGRSIAFLPGEAKGVQIPDTDIELCMTEQEMLASFWRVHAEVNKVQKELIATFNGRKFAIPFLYVRSSVQGVPIGSPDLLRDRYRVLDHIDILEAYTFHGIAAKPALLDLARLYNLPLPVTIEGGAMQKLLGEALAAPNLALWDILTKSGIRYAGITLSLGTIWRKTLRQVY